MNTNVTEARAALAEAINGPTGAMLTATANLMRADLAALDSDDDLDTFANNLIEILDAAAENWTDPGTRLQRAAQVFGHYLATERLNDD